MARKLTIHLEDVDEKTIAQMAAIISAFAMKTEIMDTSEECVITATEWPHGQEQT